MKIPDSIRIMGREFSVRFEERIILDGKALGGYVDINAGAIVINTSEAHTDMQKITLLHEMLHVLVINSGIELPNEEELVSRLAIGLYQVVADNPKVFAE